MAIENFKKYLDNHKGRNFVIVGAGGTISEYGEKIKHFIEEKDAITIGINNITSFLIPTYHLWTNTERLIEFGDCIDEESNLILGKRMTLGKFKKNINKRFSNYIIVDYIDNVKSKIGYVNNKITGYYRTAGCLSIMISHLMGAGNIYIVGMDGYTLHSKKEIYGSKSNQHLYGKGFTDAKCNDKTFEKAWKNCVRKDQMVYSALKNISKFGIEFNIITPTKFEKFYRNIL